MNTAGRGVALAVVAVLLGGLILWQGFDSPSTASVTGSGDPEPTATPTDESGGAEGDTDETGDVADDTSGDGATAQPTAVVVDDTPAAEPDPTAVLHPASEVRVLVANGTNTSGAATTTNDSLVANQGYNGLPPTNSTNQGSVTETAVYFAQGYDLDALQIAELIGAPTSAVQAMPGTPPVADLADANVLIVLGSDLVAPAG